METDHIDHASIRAEGEGMNLVEPPVVPKAKLALMNAKIRLVRMLDKIDESERAQIVASALAIALGSLARRLKVPRVVALTAAVGAGFMLGMAARGKPVKP
jgi:hypothetical protein